MSLRKNALLLCFWSSIAVAIFTIGFIVALPLTFFPNLVEWTGISAYAETFKPIQMFTVFPSILLASAYVIFTVSLHYYSENDKKIWSHLAIAFGLMYAIISTLNYLIQIITVIPSMENNQIDGLAAVVAGNSRSIFYALMASYLFMCISSLFIAFIFNNKDKEQKVIRIFFMGAGIAGPLCLLGSVVPVLMPLAGILWFVCLTLGSVKIAIYFRKLLNTDKRKTNTIEIRNNI